MGNFRRPGRTDQCLFHVPLNLQIFKRSFDNEASIEMIDTGVAEAGHPLAGVLERFPKRLNRGFPHGGKSDSSFLLEEASMDGEAVFGGLANVRSRGD